MCVVVEPEAPVTGVPPMPTSPLKAPPVTGTVSATEKDSKEVIATSSLVVAPTFKVIEVPATLVE
jgi:hypothetical protein